MKLSNPHDKRAWDSYWADVELVGHKLQVDGCTGVSELYHATCVRHDIEYRTAREFRTHRPLTREQADDRFFQAMRDVARLSKWKWRMLSPIPKIRYWGVRWRWFPTGKAAGAAWDRYREADRA
jgi:hypothetical protein